MTKAKLIALSLGALVIIIGFVFFIGYTNNEYIRTVGKDRANAERSVYEEGDSYVSAKRQAALKYYKEYLEADSLQKKSLSWIISQEFASFDEEKYLTGEVLKFIKECKYGPAK